MTMPFVAVGHVNHNAQMIANHRECCQIVEFFHTVGNTRKGAQACLLTFNTQ